MPYITNWEEKGVCWQLSGVVSSQEIFDFTNAFYADPRSDTVKYQIVDCLNVEKFELDDFTMTEIAALDYAASLSIHDLKVALVGNAPHIKLINQDYIKHLSDYHSSWTVKIFDDMKHARAWLAS